MIDALCCKRYTAQVDTSNSLDILRRGWLMQGMHIFTKVPHERTLPIQQYVRYLNDRIPCLTRTWNTLP